MNTLIYLYHLTLKCVAHWSYPVMKSLIQVQTYGKYMGNRFL